MSTSSQFDLLDVLTLTEIRRFIRNSSARGGVVFFGLLYVIGSVLVGGMLVLGNISGGFTWTILWTGGPGSNPWNYPGLLVVAPWGVIALPFFATFAMLVVAVGVGLGMTVAFLLGVRLLKPKTSGAAGSNTVGTVAGLTPAMISLVTLGACCSSTAAATAGVGLVAQASGTSAGNLLVNNWYLGVFQIVIVWVALIAQELLLVVYSGLFGRSDEPTRAVVSRRPDARFGISAVLRLALLFGGVLWSLSMVAEWTTVAPGTAGPGVWFQWIIQHQVLAGLAIAAAFFPSGTSRILKSLHARTGLVLPALILAAGVTVLWSPPPLPSLGLDGLVNQILFTVNAPATWGTISPGPVGGLALLSRWGAEYALLGGFAVLVALFPDRAFAPLLWSTAEMSVDHSNLPGPTRVETVAESPFPMGRDASTEASTSPLASPSVLPRGP